MSYQEEDYLPLSGLQHFVFCRRQWALIHIEQQWSENLLTVDGTLMHKNAHDQERREKRGDLLVVRGMPAFSAGLGISGQCDVVEFRKSPEGVSLRGQEGLWQPFPVEYKRGRPKEHQADELQLCAQAMCLEEMLCCAIPAGALYYGEPRRRTEVTFTEELRDPTGPCRPGGRRKTPGGGGQAERPVQTGHGGNVAGLSPRAGGGRSFCLLRGPGRYAPQ